jgi:outer membrane immunogenic protein
MRSSARTLMAAAVLGVGFAQVASAADLPTKAPYLKAPPMMQTAGVDWTGFYIGAHVGGAWGHVESSFADSPFPIASHDLNGFIGGGQIGYNFQSGPVVFGIEAEGSFADVKGTTGCLLFLTCTTKSDWMGTATARVGFTADKALVYVKGGAAWGNFDYSAHGILSGDEFVSGSETKWGWTVGTGVEYAITQNWSAKIEYNYLDFGKDSFSFDDGPDIDVKQQIHTVKFGLNYRFGGAPVSARY